MSNFIPANRDSQFQIKETEKEFIHVLMIREAINPKDPTLRSQSSFVQIFSVKEFDAMQRRHSRPDEWVRIAGCVAARVVHDGRIEPKQEVVKDEVAEALDSVIKEEVKAAVKKEIKKRNVRRNLQNKG